MAKQYEQKGSLLLRSDHMDYGRATLTSNWHQAREAEPKDYDVKYRQDYNSQNRNLHQSTYRRILDVTDGKLPDSTSHDHMNQINLKSDFEEKTLRYPMIDSSTFIHTEEPRYTGHPDRGFGSILPRHPDGHNRRYLESTYKVDYKDIYPNKTKATESLVTDDSSAFKKCHSQFTDVDDYRRHGRNMWHDECGVYANNGIPQETVNLTNPILTNMNS